MFLAKGFKDNQRKWKNPCANRKHMPRKCKKHHCHWLAEAASLKRGDRNIQSAVRCNVPFRARLLRLLNDLDSAGRGGRSDGESKKMKTIDGKKWKMKKLVEDASFTTSSFTTSSFTTSVLFFALPPSESSDHQNIWMNEIWFTNIFSHESLRPGVSYFYVAKTDVRTDVIMILIVFSKFQNSLKSLYEG